MQLLPVRFADRAAAALSALVAAARRATQVVAVVPIPVDIAERHYLDQATDLTYIMRGISLIGINTIALLWIDYIRTGGSFIQTGMFAALLANYSAIIWRGMVWLRRERPHGGSAKNFIDDMRSLDLILGCLWAMLLIISMRQADENQRNLLYGVMVACMATPVLVSPISCAMAYWVPLTLGAILSLFAWRSVDPFSVVCLCGFANLTGFCILYLNRRLTERAISTIRVEENNEVIKLLLRDFEENASDWLWETNAAMELLNVSDRLAQVANRPKAHIKGVFPYALIGDTGRAEHRPGSPLYRLNRFIEQRAPFRDIVIPVTVDKEERNWSLTGKPTFDKSGTFAGYHGVGSDITSQRKSQEQIAFLARHDSLTKLPNRVLFSEVLHQTCARCDDDGLALILLDLDEFKLVNDSLGHPTGDGVLVAVGERIRGCLRDRDIAARLGGDEFAIILMSDDVEHATGIARRIIERVSRPYHFDGQLVQIGASIGIAMAPHDSRSPTGLMKSADLALYRAKAEGRGIWRLYDKEMDERLQDRRDLQSDLRQALAKREFCLEFQPIVDLAQQRIVCAEALLRWQHPERGLLPPVQFIPMAEETGLIGAIGAWVLQEACRTATNWPEHVRVAVNLSPLQFRDAGLVEMIDRTLTETGLQPTRLELEITETTILETNSQTVDALWKLHARGMRIALDDFGTGYSSLSYLRRFPFDKIKIDRSFIRDLGYEKDDSSIILAIIGLAESMNMMVTAEGVETAEQAELLASYGCAQAQGYLFYRPVPAAGISNVINMDERLFDWTAEYAISPSRSAAE